MSLSNYAIEILLLSLASSLAISIVRRLVIKEEDMRKMIEANEYRKALLKAMREGDKKTVEKLERRKEYIQKIEAQTAIKNMVTLVTSMAIFFSFYWWASAYYGDTPIISLPPGLYIPLLSSDGHMIFYGWYILSSFAFGMLTNKFLTHQMPSVFGGGSYAEKSPKDKK